MLCITIVVHADSDNKYLLLGNKILINTYHQYEDEFVYFLRFHVKII